VSRHDELLEYLGRKACAMSRSRILEDLRWPGPELDAVLGTLMRPPAKVRAPRPGEYELVPAPLPGHQVPPNEAPLTSRAMETTVAHKPAMPVTPKETTMARGKKRCAQCEQSKGYRAFAAGADVCNDCKDAKKPAAKLQGGVRPASVGEIAAKHARKLNGNPFTATVELLRAEAAKYTAAADALEALGH